MTRLLAFDPFGRSALAACSLAAGTVTTLVLLLAGCAGPRDLDGLACDESGSCLPDFVCREGVCVAASVCGDGERTSGEACDGDDFNGAGCGDLVEGSRGTVACTDTCELDISGCAVTCGDGVRAPGETCDDGNLRGDDLCSRSCTAVTAPLLEAEPNDDGEVAVGVDDFLASAALGPYVADAMLAGAYANGDQDAFAVSAPATGAVAVAVALHGPRGIGTCGIGARLRMRDVGGAVLFERLDGGATGCPRLEVQLAAGQTAYIEVLQLDDNGADSYLLTVDFTP